MLGSLAVHLSIMPSEFWQMSPCEYWAILRAANPNLDNGLNSNRAGFTDEEMVEWQAYQDLVEEEEKQRLSLQEQQ